ncbi:MAG: hypothetical protein ABI851_01505 [Saprospiraceae bacterium]
MNLQQFFDYVQANPNLCLYFFAGVPALTLLISWISEPDCYKEPWKYFYTILVYAACIPGIFAVTLNVYFFFWERRSIMDAELFIQFFPILSMIITLFIIRRYISFEAIPGFDKLSGLMLIIGILLSLMWILERTNIYIFSYWPISYVILILIAGILLVRYALGKIISS